jgi:chromosome partitioning protein
VLSRYDYIILDCPLNQGLLTVNALIAADGVIAPVTSEYLSMLGVSLLLKTIGELRTEANPKLQVLGVIHTRHSQGTIHAREVMMRTNIELSGNVRVFDKPIHESIRFAEAMGQGKTVFELAPEIEGAVVYKQIAKEVVHATQ